MQTPKNEDLPQAGSENLPSPKWTVDGLPEAGSENWIRPKWWVETEDGGVRPSTIVEVAIRYQHHAARVVALDEEGDVCVSTIFLLCDHDTVNISDPNAAPVLYETMAFGMPDGESFRERYCTREQALAGHAAACRRYLGREPKGEGK